jgi:nicotinamidase/pyrazinamidase
MISRYDASTALLVVDMQNDFVDPEGALVVAGAQAILPAINQEIARARQHGAAIIYTQDWHPAVTRHFERYGGMWPTHCVRETWGAQLVPELQVAGEIVRKGTGGEDGYSGFTMRNPLTDTRHPTDLAAMLQRKRCRRLVIAGVATEYCVKLTVLDALELGYPTTVLEDAIGSLNIPAGSTALAVDEMLTAGAKLEPSALT